MKTWIIGAVALTASLWLPTTPATAATITLSGTAEAVTEFTDFGLNTGDTFTYSIDIDGSVPDSGRFASGTSLASFFDPVINIEIAGLNSEIITESFIEFDRDTVFITAEYEDISERNYGLFVEIATVFPVSGPFELDQIATVLDVVLFGSLGVSSDGSSSAAVIQTVSVEVVPLPAAGWMLLGGLGLLAAAGRRRG
ncbi:MAG: VPLPA-CTERM sorting domain-containing protein [Pseudomonadota bacterium]